jgi:vacuolar-type H+-ATPase subunit F/Vma7
MKINKSTDKDYAYVVITEKDRERIRRKVNKFLEDSAKKTNTSRSSGK